MYSYEKKTPAPAFTKMPDLASTSVGGRVLFATDEWFAAAENIINPEAAEFDPAAFNNFGKVMDGWETRRKRQAGHDWCVIRLGLPGALHGLTFDTAFFTGNQTLRVSVQGACLDEDPQGLCDLRGEGVSGIGTCASDEMLKKVASAKTEEWKELVSMTPLRPGYDATRLNYAPVVADMRNKKITHIRLNYYPDGGVARMRVHGKVLVDPKSLPEKLDLAAAAYGGVALSCSDSHYGTPANLIAPGRAVNMGGGWETARNPNRPAVFTLDGNGHLEAPGQDWAVLKLAVPGMIEEVEVDTNHFKGNFPESCQIEVCFAPELTDADDSFADGGSKNVTWSTLLPRTRLKANDRLYFPIATTDTNQRAATHVRLTIFPDGGISRLRLVGRAAKSSKL